MARAPLDTGARGGERGEGGGGSVGDREIQTVAKKGEGGTGRAPGRSRAGQGSAFGICGEMNTRTDETSADPGQEKEETSLYGVQDALSAAMSINITRLALFPHVSSPLLGQ